jgi:hypothetical protein
VATRRDKAVADKDKKRIVMDLLMKYKQQESRGLFIWFWFFPKIYAVFLDLPAGFQNKKIL